MRTLGQRGGAAAAMLAATVALSPLPAIAAGFDGDLVSLSAFYPLTIPSDLLAFGTAIVGPNVEFPSVADLATTNVPPGIILANPSVDFTTNTILIDYPKSNQGLQILNGVFNGFVFQVLTPTAPTITGVSLIQTNIPGLTSSDVSFTPSTKSIDLNGAGLTLPTNAPASIELAVGFPGIPLPDKPPEQKAKIKTEVTAGLGVTAAFGLAAALTPCGKLCEVLGVISGGLTGAIGLQDPIDLNYTVVAAPTAPPVPTLPAIPPDLSPTATTVINDLFKNTAQAIGFADAIQTALNRASGAFVSNAFNFEQVQLDAENQFFNDEQQAISAIGNDLDLLSTVLAPLFNTDFSASDFQNYEQQLATQGFSASDIAILQALGLSADNITALIALLDSQDPATLAGSYPSAFATFGNELSPAATVPEPSSFTLIGSALFLCFFLNATRGRTQKYISKAGLLRVLHV
jgi:hypothetical protein